MKVYIKEHLKRIPIVDQLYNMIVEYSRTYEDDDRDNFDDYRYFLRNDAVIRFLDYVVPTEEEFKARGLDPESRPSYISYLSALFYSVKGTYKVLDFILDYDLFQTSKGEENQGPDTTTKISYTARSITIEIDTLPATLDRDLFCNYLEKFLCTLLYFESLTITINSIGTSIVDTTQASLNHGEAFFQYYEARE